MARRERLDQIEPLDGERPEDRPPRARVERRVDRRLGPEPAAQLDRDRERRDDRPDDVAVRAALARERAVQVDEVERLGAVALEPERHLDRVQVVARLTVGLALDEPHRPAAPQIDRRNDLHALTIFE